MKFHQTPIAAAVTLALLGFSASVTVSAQTTPAAQAEAKKAEDAKKAADAKKAEPETIVVTGIRASLERSIETKKDADTNVEVVSAEDVGKMPDKNIADALSRLTGVNVQYGGALAMDEAERVAIRGTSPNLNLVTLNSHALSSGDWHVGDQAGSGRSVGFGLLPSQLIGQAIVYKTGRADITEGGIAGTVDIVTRKPLTNFRKSFTGELSVGMVHADLPKKTDPQISGLIAFQSDDKTFGVMLQAFSEKRHLRRDGQEIFGYNYITQAQANASGIPALITAAQAAAAISPTAVTNVRMPGSLNSAMFEGVRERVGGYVGVQWKPTANVDLHLSGFSSKLDADNYNSSGYGLPNTLLNNGWQIQNGVVDNNVLVGASLVRPANAPVTQRVIGFQFDHFLRQGAIAKANFIDLDGKWSATDRLSFKGRVGNTEGSGTTNSQPSIVLGLINPNITYRITPGNAVDYTITNPAGANIDLNNTANFVQLNNQGVRAESKDKEKYLHIDGEYKLDMGVFRTLKFGARSAKHKRTYDVTNPRWNAQDNANDTPVTPSPFISVTGGLLVTNIVGAIPLPAGTYPSNWASGISGNFPRSLMRYNTSQLQSFANQYINWDSVKNKNWSAGFDVRENNDAYYLMSEFEADKFSGNIGLRAAITEVKSTSYQQLPNGTAAGQCVPMQPCSVPNAIVGSRVGTYIPQVVDTKHTDWLPSLNLRWEIEPKLIGRLGITKTLGRANYNELAGAVTLNNTLLTGTSGNPRLKPITAVNVDASLAYYFARRAYVSGAVFSQDIKDYVKPGVSNVEYFNTNTGTNSTYLVTSRVQVNAKINGLELAGEMPLGNGFGVLANATYVNGKDADGLPFLGTSRMTYNLQGYYEDNAFSARLAWNHRSDYAIGLTAQPGVISSVGTHRYAAGGSLSTSLSYKITSQISVTLDANNLLNPGRKTYYITESAPGYVHESGRQYFLNLRAKF